MTRIRATLALFATLSACAAKHDAPSDPPVPVTPDLAPPAPLDVPAVNQVKLELAPGESFHNEPLVPKVAVVKLETADGRPIAAEPLVPKRAP